MSEEEEKCDEDEEINKQTKSQQVAKKTMNSDATV